MVKDTIIGTRGSPVQMEIRGIGEVMRFLRAKGIDVNNRVDLAVVRAGAFIEEELKNSIAGRRSEPQSVDTGLLLNSIKVDKEKMGEVIVAPTRLNYPGTSTNTQDVAKILEFGTSRMAPRRHFRNTADRNKKKVIAEIDKAVKKATR